MADQEASVAPSAPQVTVTRWKQFGQDRIYVNTTDGTRVGWLNVTTGVRVVEVEQLRALFDRAIDEHLSSEVSDRDGEVTGQSLPPPTPPPPPPPPPPPVADAEHERTLESTDPPEAADQPPPRPSPTVRRRSPGESAQAEYERRRAIDRERRRKTRPFRLAVLALAPLVGYGGIQLASAAVNSSAAPEGSSSITGAVAQTDPIFDAAVTHQFGLLVAFVATLTVLAEFVHPKQSTQAWRIGAEGERKTGAILRKLPTDWVVFHDLVLYGSRENIDHVVVGPPGVFTIETKNYKHGIVLKDGRATSAGRSQQKVIAQAQRQARVVGLLTSEPVSPIVAVHGPGIEVKGLFQKPIVGGVRLCSGRRLVKLLRRQPARLAPHEIERISSLLERG